MTQSPPSPQPAFHWNLRVVLMLIVMTGIICASAIAADVLSQRDKSPTHSSTQP